jgi:predicted dehydrogenase
VTYKSTESVNIGIVGLGKMGLSHLALFNAHPDVRLAGVCDTAAYTLGVLGKYTGVETYSDYDKMLEEATLDAVVIATPSDFHVTMVRKALEKGLHVFCEKPLTLSLGDSAMLAALAEGRGLVTQVGYHNRFLSTFGEARAMLAAGALGTVTHISGQAYGPVVLKPKGSTWRSQSSAGGGCLYDYAAHVINLLNWYGGTPIAVGGSVLPKIFSKEVEDAAFCTFFFPNDVTGQISVDWSDASYRKMSTSVTIRGTGGRLTVDRQECRVYLTEQPDDLPGYKEGWNVRYTTDLTKPVWFYLRGEEYSAQVEAFVDRITGATSTTVNDFRSAAATDATIAMVVADAEGEADGQLAAQSSAGTRPRRAAWRRLGRR